MSEMEGPSKALALLSCSIPCFAALSQGVLLTWLNPVLPQVKPLRLGLFSPKAKMSLCYWSFLNHFWPSLTLFETLLMLSKMSQQPSSSYWRWLSPWWPSPSVAFDQMESGNGTGDFAKPLQGSDEQMVNLYQAYSLKGINCLTKLTQGRQGT